MFSILGRGPLVLIARLLFEADWILRCSLFPVEIAGATRIHLPFVKLCYNLLLLYPSR